MAKFQGASVTGLRLAFPVHRLILRHVSLLDLVDHPIAALGLARLFLDIKPGLEVCSCRSGQGAGQAKVKSRGFAQASSQDLRCPVLNSLLSLRDKA